MQQQYLVLTVQDFRVTLQYHPFLFFTFCYFVPKGDFVKAIGPVIRYYRCCQRKMYQLLLQLQATMNNSLSRLWILCFTAVVDLVTVVYDETSTQGGRKEALFVGDDIMTFER